MKELTNKSFNMVLKECKKRAAPTEELRKLMKRKKK